MNDHTIVFKYVLLKLSSRCNINCTYCYWFRDKSVYDKPSILSTEVESALLKKLSNHIQTFRLKSFSILFHGGEPLLFGKKRFYKLCKSLKEIESTYDCNLILSLTTNGILIDNEWCALFKHFNISVTISIDGDKEEHDRHRIDFCGVGTYDKVILGLQKLRQFDINTGVLAVGAMNSNPLKVVNHFVKDLELQHFDLMIPDATHDDENLHEIHSYYTTLFDYWYFSPNFRNTIDIRLINSFVLGVLGLNTTSEGLGYGPITTITILTDGSVEPLDVLRISEYAGTKTGINILNNELQDIVKDPVWLEAYNASKNLPDTCRKCEFMRACGGGYLPHRWSKSKRYNNPSVYCNDLKKNFSHVEEVLSHEIEVSS